MADLWNALSCILQGKGTSWNKLQMKKFLQVFINTNICLCTILFPSPVTWLSVWLWPYCNSSHRKHTTIINSTTVHTTHLDVLVAMELLGNCGQPPLQLLRIHLRGVRTRRHPGGRRWRHVSRSAVVSTGIAGRWVGGCPSSQHVPTHHNLQSITFPTNSKCTLQVTMSETKTKPTQTTNAKWTEQLWNSPSHNAFSKPSWQTNKQKLNTKIWFRK